MEILQPKHLSKSQVQSLRQRITKFIGVQVKETVEEGWSGKDIADQFGITQARISELLNLKENRNISHRDLGKLIKGRAISVEQIKTACCMTDLERDYVDNEYRIYESELAPKLIAGLIAKGLDPALPGSNNLPKGGEMEPLQPKHLSKSQVQSLRQRITKFVGVKLEEVVAAGWRGKEYANQFNMLKAIISELRNLKENRNISHRDLSELIKWRAISVEQIKTACCRTDLERDYVDIKYRIYESELAPKLIAGLIAKGLDPDMVLKEVALKYGLEL